MVERSVAIITRTQNRPIALDRTLRDILEQRFTDWQLVLVSDGGNPLARTSGTSPCQTRTRDRDLLTANEPENPAAHFVTRSKLR